MEEELKIGKYKLQLSSLDKLYFPKEKFTKGNIIKYYRKIAAVLLPHLRDRPVTMNRFPNGIKAKQFFQKDAPDYFPEWIETKEIEKQEGGTTNYVICNNEASLVYLVNQACITPHIWLSRIDKPDYPNRMIFDLDPAEDDFHQVKSVAKKLRKLLEEELGLPVFLMTTGSSGLHLSTPLKRTHTFDEVRGFTKEITEYFENQFPKEVTTEIRKNKRKNKLFLDIARNAFGQTTVAPYAVRPLAGAPVATPLDWKELDKSALSAQSYTIKNIFNRLARKNDPWQEIEKKATTLTSAKKKLKKLLQ